jgi:hypothetical protein
VEGEGDTQVGETDQVSVWTNIRTQLSFSCSERTIQYLSSPDTVSVFSGISHKGDRVAYRRAQAQASVWLKALVERQ